MSNQLPSIWTTKDGQQIPIVDLETRHLDNIIAMYIRRAESLRLRILSEAYTFQCFLQGEMAIDAVDNEVEILMEMTDEELLKHEIPMFRALHRERCRRK